MQQAIAQIEMFPPTPEELTIQAVMAGAKAGFGENVSQKRVADFACALAGFLEAAQQVHGRTLAGWHEAVLNLRFNLGGV